MRTGHSLFDEHGVLHELKHFLPAQAPLKDFVHHNTLHAFQHLPFFDGLRDASGVFGYKVSLSLQEYRILYASGRIQEAVLDDRIARRKGKQEVAAWKNKLLHITYGADAVPRIGALRAGWQQYYRIDMDALVQPLLFRTLSSYLDQGIAIWNFPVHHKGFLSCIKIMERNSFSSFFKTKRARQLLLDGHCGIEQLLQVLIGDESLYKQYLFDQQFAHQGWSGMVSSIEDNPDTLLDKRRISLHDLVVFELLLEIDALDHSFGNDWLPLGHKLPHPPEPLFSTVPVTELQEVLTLWQEAFEWSYYDQVLAGIKTLHYAAAERKSTSFQALFCIDDRECSLRRYLEDLDSRCETFGTPGFFGVEFYYRPEHGKFLTKLCPAPVTPKYLIKEQESSIKHEKEPHFNKYSHWLVPGWIMSQTLGFWSVFRLLGNLVKPSKIPSMASSLKHMDKFSQLTIENKNEAHREHDLQVGFTVEEMANRAEGLLKSIGLVRHFAPLVYIIGHGSSSVNNPHYAAYDCGACSGRAGSVNARVMAYMVNHPKVREILATRDINIPYTTQFVGALHDTTRDEIVFYDETSLLTANQEKHRRNETVFTKALDLNSRERSRRFESIDTRQEPAVIHDKIRKRSVSLFEPRPELNHATNALCIVGRRDLSKGLFLDRRSFMNSYDYAIDPEGKYLFNILKAVAPVCGGINLEYFFSRVDNQKLGAGSKLPHNVMGLFGVANGIDGDLRPGLPSQMIEVHDPVRLLVVVEQLPHVVLQVIQKAADTYEWFINEWVRLAVVNPQTKELSVFEDGQFIPYEPHTRTLESIADIKSLLETHQDNLPVYLITN